MHNCVPEKEMDPAIQQSEGDPPSVGADAYAAANLMVLQGRNVEFRV